MNFRTRHLAAGIMLLAVLFCIDEQKAKAQTLAPAACQQFFSASGIPLAGGFLYSYTAGTSTLTPTYADAAASVPNSNPIILNAGGFPVSATGGCGIWLNASVSYKFVVQNSTHTAQWTVDNISTLNGLLASANTWTMLQTFSAGITSSAGPNTLGGTTSISGTQNISGTTNVTGSSTITNPCAIDGIIYVSGSGCYTSFASALAACTSPCTIDARGASTVTAIGNFDPGTTFVTLLLGPFNYTVGTITLESNLRIFGQGGTNLTSNNTTNPVIALSQVNIPASNVVLQDFALNGGTGNTAQDGIFLDCSTVSGGGLFYSRIQDLVIQGFNGVSIHLRGRPNDFLSNHQFTDWIGNTVYRGTTAGGSGEALRIEGSASNMTFYRNVLSSQAGYQLGTNIFLGQYSSGSAYPLSIHFRDTTIQSANVGVVLSGTVSIDFRDCHFENNKTGGFLFQSSLFNTHFLIDHCYFASNQFVNSSTGYIVNFSGGGVLNYGMFTNNVWGQFGGTQPDNVFLGMASNIGELVATGNIANTIPFMFTFATLPPAGDNAGNFYPISDSTTVSAEGQACAGSSTNKAVAMSNGSSYKCF